MKALMAVIVAGTLCMGMALPTLAQGTNACGHAEHSDGWFKHMDANGDGKVSWDEFLAAHTAKLQAHLQQRTEKGETKEPLDQVFAKHTTMWKQRFQAMDTNADGFVTKDEFKAYWAAHKGLEKHAGDKQQGASGSGTPAGATAPQGF